MYQRVRVTTAIDLYSIYLRPIFMIVRDRTFFIYTWIILQLSVVCMSCDTKNYKSPTGYDLEKPQKISLPPELDEISGIVYYPKDNSVLGECDEKGIIYKIPLTKSEHIKRWKLDKKRDYEDMVLLDSTFHILTSKGNLYTYTYSDMDSVKKDEYEFSFPGENEFEILYYEPVWNKLVLICKDCKTDPQDVSTAYTFDLVKKEYTKAYSLKTESIRDKVKKSSKKFKPSAAAIHPITGELFIVSSVNKLLVIADRSGNVRASYILNPKFFKQPEGMAFTSNGSLLISNESGGSGAANILIFPYNKVEAK